MEPDIQKALKNPTVGIVTAGRLLGVSRNTAYAAAKDGSIPTVRVGGQWRVPTATLRDMLGLKPTAMTGAEG